MECESEKLPASAPWRTQRSDPDRQEMRRTFEVEVTTWRCCWGSAHSCVGLEAWEEDTVIEVLIHRSAMAKSFICRVNFDLFSLNQSCKYLPNQNNVLHLFSFFCILSVKGARTLLNQDGVKRQVVLRQTCVPNIVLCAVGVRKMIIV